MHFFAPVKETRLDQFVELGWGHADPIGGGLAAQASWGIGAFKANARMPPRVHVVTKRVVPRQGAP